MSKREWTADATGEVLFEVPAINVNFNEPERYVYDLEDRCRRLALMVLDARAERDDARAEIAALRDAANALIDAINMPKGRDFVAAWEKACMLFGRFQFPATLISDAIRERDAAMAKLADAREWAGTYVNYNCSMTVYPGDALGLFDILDTAPKASYMSDKAAQALTNERCEVVTREVVLWKDYAEQLQCHEARAFDLFQPSLKARELARATVTFHVPRTQPSES